MTHALCSCERFNLFRLAISVLAITTLCLPMAAAAQPSVDDMVNALAGKTTAQAVSGTLRTRGLGNSTAASPVGQLQLSVQFDFAHATISAESKRLLTTLGTAMNSPSLAGRRFRIEGHTDGAGVAHMNLRLSERRAQSVRQFLLDQAGVEGTRLIAVGKGSSEPIDRANAAAAANRRVVVVALDDGAREPVAPASVVASTPSLSAPLPQANDTAVGIVQQLQGEATVTRRGKTTTIRQGDGVQEGDNISAAQSAALLVQLSDGAKLLVRQNTRVKLSQIVNIGALDKLRHAIDLTVGAIRYVTGGVGNSRPQNVAFKTPTATIGIRGTDIEIVHPPKLRSMQASGTYVRVNRGEIELGGSDGSTVTLAINEQAFAGAPGIKTRGGKSEPAVKKIDAPANVFASGELDSLLESR